jgi:uncharacterized RDD family membrane protein YckC
MTVSTASQRNAARPRRSAVPLRYAAFESRVTAGILDVLVLFIIASLLVTAGSLVVLISSDFEQVDPSTTSINIFWSCVGAIFPATILYFFVGLCWRGQTIGKGVMQIMVIRSDGRPLGVLGAVSRVIGQLVYVLFALGGVLAAFALRDSALQAAIATGVAFLLIAAGFLLAVFDSHRRTLHDRIAGTIVVRVV